MERHPTPILYDKIAVDGVTGASLCSAKFRNAQSWCIGAGGSEHAWHRHQRQSLTGNPDCIHRSRVLQKKKPRRGAQG